MCVCVCADRPTEILNYIFNAFNFNLKFMEILCLNARSTGWMGGSLLLFIVGCVCVCVWVAYASHVAENITGDGANSHSFVYYTI